MTNGLSDIQYFVTHNSPICQLQQPNCPHWAPCQTHIRDDVVAVDMGGKFFMHVFFLIVRIKL